jgi:chitinase
LVHNLSQTFTARGFYDASPVANAGPNQALAGGTSGMLHGAGSDVDGDSLTYHWSYVFGPNLSLSDHNIAQPTITAPTVTQPATARLQLIVQDAHSESVTDTVDIVIYPPGGNIPPIAMTGDDVAGSLASTLTIDGSPSSDFDGQIKSYSWTQLSGPKVKFSDPAAAAPTFKQYEPTDSDQAYVFELVVSDGIDLSAADTVTAVVTGYHNAAVPVGPREQLIYTNSGSVPQVTQAQHNNGTPPATKTFSSVSVPGPGRLRTAVAGSPALFNGPDNNNPGFHLSSNGAKWDGVATTSFRQTPIETAPVISNTFLEVAAGGSKTLTINGPQALSYTFLDYLYGEAQSFDIEVWYRPLSSVPLAYAGTYPTIHSGDVVRLDGRGSSDPQGMPLSYLWTQTNGPGVTLSNYASAVPLFKAPKVTTPTTIEFSLVVNNDQPSSPAFASMLVQPAIPKSSARGWDLYN